MELAAKSDRLLTNIREMQQALVCFSGGVDSGFLLAVAIHALGDQAAAFTAVSPSLAKEELAEAKQFAQQLGARHILVETNEVSDPRYAANPANRCYFCKTEVYGVAVQQARRLGIAHVLDGFNADDRGDYRPGRQAAREWNIRSPLDEAGFTKSEIRAAARSLGLSLWDKPALACLSSRLPYGTAVTPERLHRIWQCEQVLRDLGFRVCRVRHYGTEARIEVSPEEIDRLFLLSVRSQILSSFLTHGFQSVSVDLQGYRSGSLNESLLAGKLAAESHQGVVALNAS